MLRALFFAAAFHLFYMNSFAQNLVANGSMEDENICTEYEKNCAPEGWMISTLQSNFYFDDSANAYDGRHFIGLVSGGNGRYSSRNFVTGQLLCGLRAGASYQLQFFIREGTENLDSVGVYFSEDNVMYRKWGIKDVVPHFWAAKKFISSGRLPWMQVNTVFTASGAESFITIALFKKNPPEWYGARTQFSFYVDSISLLPLDPKESLCNDTAANREKLYAQNERHNLLDRQIYAAQHKPPLPVALPKTKLIRIDTLILSDILFATNSYALTKPAISMLDSFFHGFPVQQLDSIVIEGHTDNVGNKPANQKLSENRAASVAATLSAMLADNKPTMPTRGWADAKPVATNNTPAGRQQNRRVALYLYVRQ